MTRSATVEDAAHFPHPYVAECIAHAPCTLVSADDGTPVLLIGLDEHSMCLFPTPELKNYPISFARWSWRAKHQYAGRVGVLNHELDEPTQRWGRWLGFL